MKVKITKKWALYLIGGLFLLFILTQPRMVIDAIKVSSGSHSLYKEYNWYIKPNEDGIQPQGNEQAGFIKDYDALYAGNPEEKVIYLTFDAGYENGNTASILDTLKKHDAPAAFFLVGHYFKKNPDLVKRMAAEGHLICNHSMTHKNMAKITDFENYKSEIKKTEEICMQETGCRMAPYFRPPEGKFSELSLKYNRDLGYTTVFWSFAYVDWYNDKQPSEEEGFKKIIGRTHPGAIVLLHSTSRTNGLILDRVISKWEAMGYSLKSLDELKSTGGETLE